MIDCHWVNVGGPSHLHGVRLKFFDVFPRVDGAGQWNFGVGLFRFNGNECVYKFPSSGTVWPLWYCSLSINMKSETANLTCQGIILLSVYKPVRGLIRAPPMLLQAE